jgi:C4-dicarboxylate transporter DctM subunit
VGINLFISSMRFEQPVVQIIRSVLPFILILLISLALITYVPWLSLAFLK